MYYGKKHVLNWVNGDATPFNDLSVDEVSKILQGCGIDSCGNEIYIIVALVNK
jgi:hypothetical protein